MVLLWAMYICTSCTLFGDGYGVALRELCYSTFSEFIYPALPVAMAREFEPFPKNVPNFARPDRFLELAHIRQAEAVCNAAIDFFGHGLWADRSADV